LSLALHEAKNLPLIFVTNGSLTKKAKEMMNKEFRGMMFKQI
jgi:ribonucleotide monophosphatase NagD (HAD superfamily)